jgi:CHAT domain-containing protein
VKARRVLLAEYSAIGDSLILFGLRADWDQPKVASLDIEQSEIDRFAAAHFGSSANLHKLRTSGGDEQWHGFDYLIAPLARWAEPGDIVCLVPHGPLHYLPLHALRLDGSYLIERNPVVYSPSAAVLRHCVAGRRSGSFQFESSLAAVFGNSLGDLPAAEAEAVDIAKMLGTEPMLREDVNREKFLKEMSRADVVHVAGHGLFDSGNALQSGLVLSGREVLTAGEIFGLSARPTYLVTLSGCETGVSSQHPGDELIGLIRAFLYARASSVLASLWRVSDNSTAFLMQQFYRRLLDDPSCFKADALRLAILDTMAQLRWSHFYHWAPFVLVGDWR